MKRIVLTLLAVTLLAPSAFAEESPAPPPLPAPPIMRAPAVDLAPAPPAPAEKSKPSMHVLFLPGVRTMDSNKWQINVSDGSGDASKQTVYGGEFDFAMEGWPANILIGGSWSQSSKNNWGRSSDTGTVTGTVWEGYLGARKYFGDRTMTPYVNVAVAGIGSRLEGKGYVTSETTEVGVMGGGGLLLNLGPFVMGVDGRTTVAADVGSYAQITGVVGFRF